MHAHSSDNEWAECKLGWVRLRGKRQTLYCVVQQPLSKGHELTPRIWTKLFADNLLDSDLHLTVR
ncbi:MAG: hypothetical protein ACXWJK_07025 [Burkholderiaceae bacterium]